MTCSTLIGSASDALRIIKFRHKNGSIDKLSIYTTCELFFTSFSYRHSIFGRGEQTTDGPKDVLGHLCCYMDCAPAMRKYPVCRHFVKGTV